MRQTLEPPDRPPLTVGEALRNIANEVLERRRLSAQHHPDRLAAEPVLDPFHELQENRPQVGV